MRNFLLPTLLVLAAIGLMAFYFSSVHSQSEPKTGPSIEYPAKIELSPAELGQVSKANFTIKNLGDSPLAIRNIRTSCSCTGLELMENGRYRSVVELSIPPKQSVEFVARVTVRGVPVGSRMKTEIRFETNDPVSKECLLDLLVDCVSGGVYFNKDTFSFGTKQIGDKVEKRIDIIDCALELRKVESVIVRDGSLVQAKYVPEVPPVEVGKGKRRIGFVDVKVDCGRACEINETVHVKFAENNANPLALKVFGRVVNLIEIAPAEVSLPLRSSKGLLFETNILVRSTMGPIDRIECNSENSGVYVKIPTLTEGQRLVNVTVVVNENVIKEKSSHWKLLFNVSTQGQIIPVNLTVNYERP